MILVNETRITTLLRIPEQAAQRVCVFAESFNENGPPDADTLHSERVRRAAIDLREEYREHGWTSSPLQLRESPSTTHGRVVLIEGHKGTYAAALLVRLLLELIADCGAERESFQITWSESSSFYGMNSGGFYNIREDGSIWGLKHELCECVDMDAVPLTQYAPPTL